MPKVKTKKIALKRFKVSKKGKLLHRTQGRRHIRRTKSKSRQRRQDKDKKITNKRYITKISRFVTA